jgi:GNAT superfamily N-acetyltransferase
MYIVNKEYMHKISILFQGWEETLLWSCLQGYMGNAWTDNLQNPTSAQIITGDFCFFAGDPNAELVHNIPSDYPSESILMTPLHEGWAALIEQEYQLQAKRTLRYAIKKEPGIFDRDRLNSYIEQLPSEFEIKMIDEELYHTLKSEPWSNDLCSQFASFQSYQTYGLGFVALHEGIPVSGASSYTVYDKGIEIEIDTKSNFRRKGLALACSARLILECLDRGLYPSWDAHDIRSVSLAEKLGYHMDKEYVTYSVSIVR